MNIIQSIFLREEKNRELIDHKKLLYIDFILMNARLNSIDILYIYIIFNKIIFEMKSSSKKNKSRGVHSSLVFSRTTRMNPKYRG